MYQKQKLLVPTANVTINKSRIKQHNKDSKIPSYYLNDGDSFQLELFNPTTSDILAKISIDGKLISQNGLIIRRGERIFLDRYLDVAKKFQFSTYTVSNTDEVKTAIQENGDLKIEFFEEYIEPLNQLFKIPQQTPPSFPPQPWWEVTYGSGGMAGIYDGTITTNNTTNVDITFGNETSTLGFMDMDMNTSTYTNNVTGSLNLPLSEPTTPKGPNKRKFKKNLKSKKIETGQVSEGGKSDQTMEMVNRSFAINAFHTVEYKLLPTSQKNVTSDEVINKYCTQCSTKIKKGWKFCSSCGGKI